MLSTMRRRLGPVFGSSLAEEQGYGFTPQEEAAILQDLYARGDRVMRFCILAHFLLALGLAPVHQTWAVTLPVATLAVALFFVSSWALPRTFLTRCLAGVSLQTFVALHLYQMPGLPELHFFFFTAAAAMICYCDWECMWPGTLFIIGQHLLFASLANVGVGTLLFPEGDVSSPKLFLHSAIAIVHVALCGWSATLLRRQSLLLVWHRRASRHLASIARATQYAVVLTDTSGHVVWVNEGFTRTTGYSLAEVMGRKPEQLLEGPETDVATVALIRAAVRAEVPFEGEIYYYTKEGRGYWLSLSIIPIHSDQGELQGFISIEMDVTERHRAANELTRALAQLEAKNEELAQARDAALASARAKSEFLANVSHELRTPLNGILGMTELVLESELAPQQREYLTIVNSSGESLLVLVNDILDFARMEAGRFTLHPQPFSLRSCVTESVRSLAVRAQAKDLELHCRIAPGVPECVVGDRIRLRQVLINLIGNAIKFTAQGEVVVTVERDDLIHFSVADTGIGIPADRQGMIFDAFTQADGSISREYGGTGLGLAICRELVTAMGGEIQVESPGAGKGSVFRFALPLDVERDEDVVEPPPVADAPVTGYARGSGLRILLAEDNSINQRLAIALLERRGHQVRVAGDGSAAIAAWEEEPFDLILMDVQMPGVDGLEATAAIRSREEGTPRRTPILALTAHAAGEDRERCLAAGMDGYLSKPIQTEALFHAIRTFVN